MAEKSQTYTLKFQASAQGLDEIIKKLGKIAQTSGLNLTDKMVGNLSKIQAQMQVFMQALKNELSKEVQNPLNLEKLNKEFEKITEAAKQFGLNLSSLQLPPELQQQLTEITSQLKEAEKKLSNSKRRENYASRKLDPEKETGLSEAGEKLAFNKADLSKIDSGSTKVFGDINEIVEAKNALEEYIKQEELSAEAISESKERIEIYTQAIKDYKTACEDVKKEAEQKIANEKEIQQLAKEEINTSNEKLQNIQSQINAANTEQEVSKESIEILKELSRISQKQSDAKIEETQRINAEIDAKKKAEAEAKKAEKAKEDEAKQQERLKSSLIESTGATKQNNEAVKSNTSLVAKASKQVFTYGTIMSFMKRIYRETITTITEMDKALTGMAVVTSMSREETWQLVGSFQKLAEQTGKTTSEIAAMATKFYQQGKSTQQVLQLTEAAAKAATIAGIDGSRSIDLLTNAMNGFQMSANQAMIVSDKFAALAASAATDYEELATALSKVAAQANLAGMSMDFTLGMLTKGIEVTREAPETIGTALKTVISRMRELTDYGKTLEDNIDVNRVEKALGNIGVELRDESGQFRDLESVLTEVGKKWDTLNKNQQANVAVALAGTRQQSRLIAMMQDFDRTLELVDTAANSYGATMAQSAKYMEGLEAKTTLLTNSYQNLITNITNSEFIIGGIEFITKLVNFVDSLLQNTAAMIPILITVSTITLGIVARKIEEVQLQAKINQYAQEQESLKRKEELANLKILQLKQKEERKEVEALVKGAKEILQEKKKTLELINQTKEQEKQSILKDSSLSSAEKEAKLKALDVKYAGQISEAEKEVIEAQEDYNAAKELESEYKAVDLKIEKLNTEEKKYQLSLYAQQNGLIGGFLSKLGLIQTAMTVISGLQKGWNLLVKVGNSLHEQGMKQTLKDIGLRIKAALIGSADSASKIPVAGWVIALSLLAAAGIAIGGVAIANAQKAKESEESTQGTIDSLNKMQAELYNMNKSIDTVSKLGDEFDSLNNKVIKTTEDLERLGEIAQQINDEAGYTVVDINADAESQAAQIKGYESMLKYQKTQKVGDIQSKIEAGYESQLKYEGLSPEEYFNNLGSAGEASLRTIATERLSYLSDLDNATQEIIKQAFVKAAPQMLEAGDGKLDMSMFTKDVAAISEQLDKTVTSGSLAEYKKTLQSLSPELQKIFKESNTTFAAVNNLSNKSIEAFDKLKLSTEGVNTIMTLTQENAKEGGKSFEEILTDAEQAAGATGNLSEEIYKQMIAEQEAAVERAKQWELTQKESDKAIIAAKKVAIASKEAQLSNNKLDDKEREKLEKSLIDEREELGNLEKAYEENENAAKIAKDNIQELNNAFITDNAMTTYTDALTKIGSSLERISKVNDLASLSIAEQMELLNDYPQLVGAMEKGVLDASSALEILNADFAEQRKILGKDLRDIGVKFEAKEEDRKLLEASGLGLGYFKDENLDEMKDIIIADIDAFVEKMAEKGIEQTNAERIYGAIEDYVEKSRLADLMDEKGIALTLKVDFSTNTNQNLYDKAKAQLEGYNTALEKEVEGSQKYNDLLNEQNNLRKTQIKNIDNLLDKNGEKLKGFFGDVDKTIGSGSLDAILSSFEIVNGEFIPLGEKFNRLNDQQKAALISQSEALKKYAKEQKELADEQYELYKEIAQQQIDAEKRVTEACIEELEKRKEAYEKYFEELDSLEAEEERAQNRDSLINQIAALTGALDGSGKSKIKELKQQLADLEKEELQAQKERQRDALLTSMDDQIEELNQYTEDLDKKLPILIKALQDNTNAMLEDSRPNTYLPPDPNDSDITNDSSKKSSPSSTSATPGDFANYTVDATVNPDTAAVNETVTNVEGDITVNIESIVIQTEQINNEQDARNLGSTIGEELIRIVQKKGLNINAKK